jgi:glycosyltransferase involved in cell wall biosynthesis
MPIVSVIIPAHNGEMTIQQTIKSVLNQTLSSLELIVVDDGSTDSTLGVLSQVEDPRLKVFSYHNAGVAASRNRGLAHASGEYAAFLDHDDLWTSDKLEAQHTALQKNPQAAVAYSLVNCIDETGRFLHPGSRILASGNVYARLLLTDFLDTTSNPMIRKHAIEQVGGFDESFASADDWDLFLRLASKYPFVCVPRVQILYREYPDSLSFDVERMEEAALAVCDNAFASAPASLQHLKRASAGNLYKYLAVRALRGHPGRNRGLQATRFLSRAVRHDPALLLTLAFVYTGCVAAAMILLPRWVEVLYTRWERLSSVNALLKHIRGDPRRSSGLFHMGLVQRNTGTGTASGSGSSLIQHEDRMTEEGKTGSTQDAASGKHWAEDDETDRG